MPRFAVVRVIAILLAMHAGSWPWAALAEPAARILVGLDGKAFFEPDGFRVGEGGHDAVLVVDVTEPARPRVVHTLPLSNSVYGPPTNLAITPDGRLGLVASSMRTVRDGAGWRAEPDDRPHVIDLATEPPALVETVTVGRQPSGLAIGPGGDVALLANRAGRSVTVLSIEGRRVRPVAEVDLGDEVAGVAIAPDGSTALAVKNATGFVAVLRLDGRRVSYDPAADLPVGRGAYSAAFTPDGRLAITANTGPVSDGHADTASVIRLDGPRPRVSAHVTVGDTPEVLAVAPDGRHAVAVVVRGSSAPRGSPAYTPTDTAVLLSIGPAGEVAVADEVEVGALPEGIAFGPYARHVYVGNYVDRTLSVLRIEGDRLVKVGEPLVLPGQPAYIGGITRG